MADMTDNEGIKKPLLDIAKKELLNN